MKGNKQTNVRNEQGKPYCIWCAQPILRGAIDVEDDYGYTQSYHRHCYQAYLNRWE